MTVKIRKEASVTCKLSRQEGNLLLRNSVRVIAETHSPRDPSVLPSLSPTILQFNVCKRILFQSLAPSRMVLLESPRALLFTSPPPTEVFPCPCVTTCSLIFTNANIMSEPVKNVPFSLYLSVRS